MKDPSRLSLQAASTLGSVGQVCGKIAEAHGGVIGMTGSGFIDPGGTGNGGTLAGYAMCNGKSYGSHMGYGYKRLELHKDNRIYIRDSDSSVSPDTTDAVEFSPAMIIDGETVVTPAAASPTCSRAPASASRSTARSSPCSLRAGSRRRSASACRTARPS